MSAEVLRDRANVLVPSLRPSLLLIFFDNDISIMARSLNHGAGSVNVTKLSYVEDMFRTTASLGMMKGLLGMEG